MKYFFMAALALMTAACSNDDNDILAPAEQPANNMITITAKLAPKSGSAQTRTLSDQTTYIKAEWAQNEQLKIISANGYPATANIDAVDGSGVATISFTIDAAAKGKDCTIIYPATAAVTESAGVYTALPMTAQTGTLTNDLDVRIGKGTITDEATPQLEVTTQPAAQFAIWKLTTPSAKNLCIMANGVLIAEATLASAGTEFYVAVPAVDSKTVAVVATDESSNCWSFSKAGVSLVAGKYYQSSHTMTALGTESSADVYKITGTVGGQTIDAGKTVVLSGVNISDGQIACSGNANIILMGTNSVTAPDNKAAIKIGGSSTTLTITGSGSLTATGGRFGAGIGTDYNGSGGNIVINGGSVTANGGDYSAGIGTGRAGNATNTCGDITINGGTVSAQGVNGGAGIGTGLSSSASNTCGAITIGTGVIRVTANKSSISGKAPAPNSIGKGRISGNGTQNCSTITFGSAQVFNGTDWSPSPMVAGTYGGLTLAFTTTTNTDDTWTLTPAP